MTKYKYILFDWDGCLIKTLDLWLKVNKEIAIKYGADLTFLSDRKFVEISFGKWEKGFSDLGIKDAKHACKEAVTKFLEDVDLLKMYPSATQLLDELVKKNFKLALHTSSYRAWIEKPFRKFAMTRYFKVVVAKDDVIKGKPDPEVIIKALKLLGGNKKEALIVGDSDHDILAGNNAGVDTCLFYPKSNHKFYANNFLSKTKPDYTITELKELLKVVQ